jgi:hypothetical protein
VVTSGGRSAGPVHDPGTPLGRLVVACSPAGRRRRRRTDQHTFLPVSVCTVLYVPSVSLGRVPRVKKGEIISPSPKVLLKTSPNCAAIIISTENQIK